jgi:hypothetical protein
MTSQVESCNEFAPPAIDAHFQKETTNIKPKPQEAVTPSYGNLSSMNRKLSIRRPRLSSNLLSYTPSK